MPRCTVVNCHCGYDNFPTPNGLRWFKIPKAQARRKQWEWAIHRKDFVLSNDTRVCSIHFDEGDFIPEAQNKDSSGRQRKKSHLKDGAVPHLHMGKCKCPEHHRLEKTSKPLLRIISITIMIIVEVFYNDN